jgi:hypothetical protein
MTSCWRLEQHVRTRRLDDSVLVYHLGSGDTHALNFLSSTIVELLADAEDGYSVDELSACRVITVTKSEIVDALTMLADFGVVECRAGP